MREAACEGLQQHMNTGGTAHCGLRSVPLTDDCMVCVLAPVSHSPPQIRLLTPPKAPESLPIMGQEWPPWYGSWGQDLVTVPSEWWEKVHQSAQATIADTTDRVA